MANANDNSDRFEIVMILAKLNALSGIVKMIAGNGLAEISADDEAAWVADVNRYAEGMQPPPGMTEAEMLEWGLVKDETVAMTGRILDAASDMAAKMRAMRSAR